MISAYVASLKSRTMIIPIYVVPAFVNLLIASHLSIDIVNILLLTFSVALISYSVYWYNDYIDIQKEIETTDFEDTVHSQRPLAKGTITRNKFFGFILVNLLVGFLLASMINAYVFLILTAFWALGYIYSTEPIRLKKRVLGKQLTILLGCALTGIVGAVVYRILLPLNIYSVVVSCLLFTAAPMINDLRDIETDRKTGDKTIAVLVGSSSTIKLAMIMISLVILTSIVGYFWFEFSLIVPVLTTIVMTGWLYYSYTLFSRWEDKSYTQKAGIVLYLSVIFIQFIPIIGII